LATMGLFMVFSSIFKDSSSLLYALIFASLKTPTSTRME
jgi:hypothetical protein